MKILVSMQPGDRMSTANDLASQIRDVLDVHPEHNAIEVEIGVLTGED